MSVAARAGILYGPRRPAASRTEVRSPEAIITKAGERSLRSELERLRHELDVEFAARLREARAFGGATENDDYLQIQEEEAVLASRIARLEALLASATVIEDEPLEGGQVAIGSIVEVQDADSGVVDEYVLVGGYEGHALRGVSVNSPIGRALLGRAPGEEIEVGLPDGRRRRLKILATGMPGPG